MGISFFLGCEFLTAGVADIVIDPDRNTHPSLFCNCIMVFDMCYFIMPNNFIDPFMHMYRRSFRLVL